MSDFIVLWKKFEGKDPTLEGDEGRKVPVSDCLGRVSHWKYERGLEITPKTPSQKPELDGFRGPEKWAFAEVPSEAAKKLSLKQASWYKTDILSTNLNRWPAN